MSDRLTQILFARDIDVHSGCPVGKRVSDLADNVLQLNKILHFLVIGVHSGCQLEKRASDLAQNVQ